MLDNLRAFIEVAERGSFSAVAHARNVAVSSVTRQIDALEHALGIRLFHRSSRRLLLTDAGQQFVRRARGIVSDFDEAKASLLDDQVEPRGVLSVTVPSSFGRRHVVPAAASFLQRYPHVELDMHFSDQWVDLTTSRVDVAIRIGALPDSDLTATRLAPIWRLVCASPDYLQRKGRPENPAQLLQHSCLTVPSTTRTPTGWWTFDGINNGKPLGVRGPFRTDDTEALLQAAVAGMGFVHLASWLVSDLLTAGYLVCVFPTPLPAADEAPTAIHAVWLKGRSQATKSKLFIAHLRKAFGSPTYWDRVVADAVSRH